MTNKPQLDHDGDGKAGGAAPALAAGLARVRVLKAGDGKVAKGVHDADNGGEQYYAKGDEFAVAEAVAIALEDRGFVEIQ